MHPPAARLAQRQPVFPLAARSAPVLLSDSRCFRWLRARRAANHSPGRRWPSRCKCGKSPSADRELGALPRRCHFPTGVQRRAARYHQARCCHGMTTCFSRSKLVFAAKLSMSSGARYGKNGEIVFKGKIVCACLRTNLARCYHVIFISIILFRALGNGLERRRRRCGTLCEANQKRKPDH